MRTFLVIAVLLAAGQVSAASKAQKEAECGFQADLIGQVQAARLERVKKGKVVETLVAQNPDWPSGVASVLPAVVEYVWGFKRSDLKKVDLEADTMSTCLANYDEIQSLKSTVSN